MKKKRDDGEERGDDEQHLHDPRTEYELLAILRQSQPTNLLTQVV
jgi:hypothetical protein